MVSVIAPLFSISATGLIGKTILYYNTKYGARVRKIKRGDVVYGNTWEVNKEWFKLASTRAKLLTEWMKKAWLTSYADKCDTWRDLFMGKQIEMWNLSPLNDILWPPVSVGDVGAVSFIDVREYDSVVFAVVVVEDFDVKDLYCVSYVWFNVLDSLNPPVEANLVIETDLQEAGVPLQAGHTNRVYGGVRYLNGTFKVSLLGSFVR